MPATRHHDCVVSSQHFIDFADSSQSVVLTRFLQHGTEENGHSRWTEKCGH